MCLIATNNRKNIVSVPPKIVFGGEMTPFQKIVVSYMIPNFRDQESRVEGSKMRPRPRLCIPRPRP